MTKVKSIISDVWLKRESLEYTNVLCRTRIPRFNLVQQCSFGVVSAVNVRIQYSKINIASDCMIFFNTS